MINNKFQTKADIIKYAYKTDTSEGNVAADKLYDFFEKYPLKWIEYKNEPYFFSSNLAECKGLAKGDFSVKGECSRIKHENIPEALPGVILIKGDELKTVKKLFEKSYGPLPNWLKKAPQIYILNWTATVGYLVQGRSEAARDMIDAVATSAKEVINNDQPVLSMTPTQEKQQMFLAMADYYGYKAQQEALNATHENRIGCR